MVNEETFKTSPGGFYTEQLTSGPGSLTCDRAGPVTLEDCKSCLGTGGCRCGKTDEEFKKLVAITYRAHLPDQFED